MTMQAGKLHKWSSAFPTPEALAVTKKTWRVKFEQTGLSEWQISFGSDKALNIPGFPPDLAEFISLCRPSAKELGMPTAEQAYREAGEFCHIMNSHNWSHPGVYAALRKTGHQLMRNGTVKESRDVFMYNYELICRKAMNGESLGYEIPKALPAKVDIVCTPEENKSNLAALRASTGL